MSGKNRSNLLLVEILIALLFFMLSATVLVQVFSGARSLSQKSEVEIRALAEAQNVADQLIAVSDRDQALADMGFDLSHGVWARADGDYTLYVEGGWVDGDNGRFWQGSVRAYCPKYGNNGRERADEELFCLPCLIYEEAAL